MERHAMSNQMDLDNDVRIIRRNLAKGLVSRASVEEMVAKLPDVADQAEWIDPSREETEADDTAGQ
tara:strand:- start:337 stop:534 length:198 start_codon:yes stop_codon:yes gene_type:complete